MYINRRNGFVVSIIKEVLGGVQKLFWFITFTLAEFWKYVLVSLQTQKGKLAQYTSIIQRENLSKLILAKLGSHFMGSFTFVVLNWDSSFSSNLCFGFIHAKNLLNFITRKV